MKKFIAFLVVITVLTINCSDDKTNYNSESSSITYTLGISFPPVSDNEQRNFTDPLLNELNVKHIRIGEDWSFREPIQGSFNWQPLDDRINWATENNINILLTIQSNGPDWACSDLQNQNSCVYNNNNEFKNYIQQLLQRYPNQISKIQFGNEWQSDFWYIGSEEQFTEANNIVYDAIQQYSPETQLILGGFTTISLRFLAGCNGLIDSFYNDEGDLFDQDFFNENCDNIEFQTVINRINYILDNASYDLLDIHLYDDVENWMIYYENFITLTTKPVIITEFGGPNLNLEPTSEQYQSERLKLYIETIDSMKVDEAYFFKLVEGSSNPAHAQSGLIDNETLNKKLSFFAFKDYNN
ncbi:glycosyl hydrolase [Winogradskyella flava]|uniref:Cellulase family glycosylhydrolase n=1 Tax=Winogradskyella flava TaxID=1884876 RepID=A0A842IUU3_9FLAO|nr:glycosyl hydrolase [Winogradskyella flava]MBC2845684.1 cellulase family glycosylhydrolase [Winogradskyella flava]